MEALFKPTMEQISGVISELDIELNEAEIKQLSLADVKVPFIMQNKRLISPGVHNGFEYTAELIKNSVEGTKFTKENSFLNLNHEDNSVDKWAGEVRSIYWNSQDGAAYGDLWFMDPMTAIKLMLGARFGVSIKGQGSAFNGKVKTLTYSNFGVVINPACKTTFLNDDNGGVKEETIISEIHSITIKNEEVSDKTINTKIEVIKMAEDGEGDKTIIDDKVDAPEGSKAPIVAPIVDDKSKVDSAVTPATANAVVEDKEKEALKAKVAAFEKKEADAVEAARAKEISDIQEKNSELESKVKELVDASVKNGKAVTKPITTLKTNTSATPHEDALSKLTSDDLDEAFAELVMGKATKQAVWTA